VTVSFVGRDSATPVLGSDGRYRAVYELILTNTKPVPASLDAVDVLDAANNSKLLGLKGKDLIDNLRTLDVQPVKGASLPPNESRLLYITVIFDSKDAIPDALDHQIEVNGADNPGATKPSSLKPGALPDPGVFTELGIVSVDGNHVVIDHGNGLYSFYAHLQKGSIKVKVGDKVQAGDELGLLGNTGNSSAPHMHFHIMNGPSPLGAEGVPYVFDSFQLAGVANPTEDEFDKARFEGAATFPSRANLNPVEHRDEMPLDNAIMDFPSG
jgi:hypothetical protein